MKQVLPLVFYHTFTTLNTKIMFTEIRTDYIDHNGVVFIDGYKTSDENDEGTGIGYFFNGEVYWRNTEYQFDPMVQEVVKKLKEAPNKFILSNIDYVKLREQKETLLELGDLFDEDSMNGQALDGVINLIDSIQDYAVDVLGKPESEVFNLE